LRGYGEPEEFGWAAAFVLSPAASLITGAMRDDPGGRGCHQLDLSTRSRA
jgi:3-oxoacyl-[acyl-carrier protein] reductase